MTERLQQLIDDWRDRARPQPDGYVSRIPPCCVEEILGCAAEVADEVALEAEVLSDQIHELASADYRDARDGETSARFDRFADEALDLSKLALRACADPPQQDGCAECAARDFRIQALQDSIDGCTQKVLALANENRRLRACAEARPSTEKGPETNDDLTRSETLEISDRLRSSAPTDGAVTTSAPNDGWRCFHCEEVFTNEAEAREHFGSAELSTPGCAITIAEFRQMEQHVADIRRENEEMSNDASMYHAQSHELERLFGKGVLSAHQAWLRWEEQESRAMAAEERLAELDTTSPRAEALAALRLLATELREEAGPPVEDTAENFPGGHDMTERRFLLQWFADRLDVLAAEPSMKGDRP